MRTRLIFVCGDIKVYAAHFTAEDGIVDLEYYPGIENETDFPKLDEFEKAMGRWSDPEYLRDFFIKYKKDLSTFHPGYSVNMAVRKTLEWAAALERKLMGLSDNGNETALHALFKPLQPSEGKLPLYFGQHMKVYSLAPNSWLRIYALRYNNCYLITGGAIKLPRVMNIRPHLETERYKLKYAGTKVKVEGIQGTINLYGETD